VCEGKVAGGRTFAIAVCRLLEEAMWTADCVRLLDGSIGGVGVGMYYH